MSSLFALNRFGITEDCAKADAILRGSVTEDKGQKSRSEGEGASYHRRAVSATAGVLAAGSVGVGGSENLSSSETQWQASITLLARQSRRRCDLGDFPEFQRRKEEDRPIRRRRTRCPSIGQSVRKDPGALTSCQSPAAGCSCGITREGTVKWTPSYLSLIVRFLPSFLENSRKSLNRPRRIFVIRCDRAICGICRGESLILPSRA